MGGEKLIAVRVEGYMYLVDDLRYSYNRDFHDKQKSSKDLSVWF